MKRFLLSALVFGFAGAAQAQQICHDVEQDRFTPQERAALARAMIKQSPTPKAKSEKDKQMVLKVFIAPDFVRADGWTVLRASQAFYDPKTDEQYDTSDQVPFFFSKDPLKSHYVGYLEERPYGFNELEELMPGIPEPLVLCFSDPNVED